MAQVVNGFTEYDAKGEAQRAFLAWFWSGGPTTFPLGGTAPLHYETKRYDAFGRGLMTYGLDGAAILGHVYHALSSDAWDGADLAPGPHHGTPASEVKDGHGRTISVIERAHVGSAIDLREVRTEYLPTGEVAKITRVHTGTTDTPVTRWIRYDSLGRMVLNVEPNTSAGFVATPIYTDVVPSTLKAWRYAYDDAGNLVGTSDARGCGANYIYESAGRLTAEDFSPCQLHHQAYSAPDFTYGGESGLEALYRYDYAPPSADITAIEATEHDCTIHTSFYLGRLASVADRGAKTVTVYDGRGRVSCVGRQMSKPGTPTDALASRYANEWYVQVAAYDGADRPIDESTGANVSELMGGDGKSRVTTAYTTRGSVKSVGGSYGTLIASVVHDADGRATRIVHGDVAHTTTDYGYDARRRLRTHQTYRGPPAIWTSAPSDYLPAPTYGAGTPTTFQLILENLEYSYDLADNPVEIRDWRSAAEWPSGAKPVTRLIDYDDLYRVIGVQYQHTGGPDPWVSPFAPENGGLATDPRLATPAPHISFDGRMLWQSFEYNWLGNIVQMADDASGFYDRSLGTVEYGSPYVGPQQLQSATNETSSTGHAGHLSVAYDAAGELISLVVVRSGTCLPSGATCSHRYRYDWDETGRLAHARRWDAPSPGTARDATPTGTPDAELLYQYDSGDQRTLKTSVRPGEPQLHTIYPLRSLEIRRALFSTGDYAAAANSVVPYLFASGVRIARVAWEDADAPRLGAIDYSRLHVFLEMANRPGQISAVIDKATAELIEMNAPMAYGATEVDFRPLRWKCFREDYRFAGKEEDVELGVSYFGYRYHAPSLAQWLSADPAFIHSLGPDAHPYAYVDGRPLQSTDTAGLWSFPDWFPGGKRINEWRDDLYRANTSAYERAWGRVDGFLGQTAPGSTLPQDSTAYKQGKFEGEVISAGIGATGGATPGPGLVPAGVSGPVPPVAAPAAAPAGTNFMSGGAQKEEESKKSTKSEPPKSSSAPPPTKAKASPEAAGGSKKPAQSGAPANSTGGAGSSGANPTPPSATTATANLLVGATPGKASKPGMGSIQYTKPGGFSQANADFDLATQGLSVTNYGNGVRSAAFADGTTMSVRPGSSQGSPTVQVDPPSGNPIKIRYN